MESRIAPHCTPAESSRPPASSCSPIPPSSNGARPMQSQYHHVRGARINNPLPVGAIVYVQDPQGLRSRYHRSIRANPWIIEAWHNRECMGRYLVGGHLATVRSLRDGRRVQVADWLLLASVE